MSNMIGIIGGGSIGLSCGWQLVRNGYDVTIFEAGSAGQAASRVAAGMLAPQAEAGFEEVDLMKLGQESLSIYPQFIQELQADAGHAPEIDHCGTLLVGIDRDDTEQLKRLYQFREELALNIHWLTGTEAREMEPSLSPRVIAAIWLPDDAQINNRQLLQTLKDTFQNLGGHLQEHMQVTQITPTDKGFELTTSQSSSTFSKLLITAGSWSNKISFSSQSPRLPVRPVKGQVVTLRQTEEFELDRMIRSPRGYMAPKKGGYLAIGASSEERGFESYPTAGATKDILENAWEVVPGIYDLPLEEVSAGLRPGTVDHGPIVGETDQQGLFIATGHYRHGILLSPITAYGILNAIQGADLPPALEHFRPGRFESSRSET